MNTIQNFERPNTEETIIPTQWFDDRRKININLPFCHANEAQSKKFIQKLNFFTQGHYKFSILWQTKKLSTLFRLKDKNIHPSHTVYIGTCSCNQEYVGETSRNLKARIMEHEDISKVSEPARHLSSHPLHSFSWKPIVSVHSWSLRRITEALLIAKYRPALNKQVQAFTLSLFPMGIT